MTSLGDFMIAAAPLFLEQTLMALVWSAKGHENDAPEPG